MIILRRPSNWIFIAIIIVCAVVVIYIFDDNTEEPAHVVSSFGRTGVSLLFDTLNHMNYPVQISRSPLTPSTNPNHAYIIIQPSYPLVCWDKAEEMLDWVFMGGRLFFFHNSPTTIFDTIIEYDSIDFGRLRVYEFGRGSVVIGPTREITNYNLMHNADTATSLESLLYHWNPDIIWFGEYYHSMPGPTNFVMRMPLIVRLSFVQLTFVGFAIVWHLGKRFGRPAPFYEEYEREENEQVHALTRLYLKIRRPEK